MYDVRTKTADGPLEGLFEATFASPAEQLTEMPTALQTLPVAGHGRRTTEEQVRRRRGQKKNFHCLFLRHEGRFGSTTSTGCVHCPAEFLHPPDLHGLIQTAFRLHERAGDGAIA